MDPMDAIRASTHLSLDASGDFVLVFEDYNDNNSLIYGHRLTMLEAIEAFLDPLDQQKEVCNQSVQTWLAEIAQGARPDLNRLITLIRAALPDRYWTAIHAEPWDLASHQFPVDFDTIRYMYVINNGPTLEEIDAWDFSSQPSPGPPDIPPTAPLEGPHMGMETANPQDYTDGDIRRMFFSSTPAIPQPPTQPPTTAHAPTTTQAPTAWTPTQVPGSNPPRYQCPHNGCSATRSRARDIHRHCNDTHDWDPRYANHP